MFAFRQTSSRAPLESAGRGPRGSGEAAGGRSPSVRVTLEPPPRFGWRLYRVFLGLDPAPYRRNPLTCCFVCRQGLEPPNPLTMRPLMFVTMCFRLESSVPTGPACVESR